MLIIETKNRVNCNSSGGECTLQVQGPDAILDTICYFGFHRVAACDPQMPQNKRSGWVNSALFVPRRGSGARCKCG